MEKQKPVKRWKNLWEKQKPVKRLKGLQKASGTQTEGESQKVS